MYELRAFSAPLLAKLWRNLWERGIQELDWLGYTLPEGFYLFMQHAANARTSGILCCDGVPKLCAGIVPTEGESFTFMQASKDFEQHLRPIIRTIRNATDGYPDPLYIYSVCVHPGTTRFFKTLGFVPDAWLEMTRTGHPLYRFRRV